MMALVIKMRQNTRDELKQFNLPFQTFFNPCTNHEEEIHDEMEFIWLFEGEINITCEKTTYLLKPNHVFMFYMGQAHSMESTGNTVSIAFRLSKDYLQDQQFFFEKIPFAHRIFTFLELAHKYHQVPLIMSQLILLMKSPSLDPSIHYRLMGYYNMYLHDLYKVCKKDHYLDIKKKNFDPYLLRYYTINEYIKNNYYRKIDFSEMAKLLGISTFRLSHFFREILGISLQEYIQNVRTERALLLLRNTTIPIEEIVHTCGFSDHKYLNHEIKKRFHVTALAYRKIMRDHLHFGIPGLNYPKMLQELSKQLHHMHTEVYIKDDFGLHENIQSIER